MTTGFKNRSSGIPDRSRQMTSALFEVLARLINSVEACVNELQPTRCILTHFLHPSRPDFKFHRIVFHFEKAPHLVVKQQRHYMNWDWCLLDFGYHNPILVERRTSMIRSIELNIWSTGHLRT